MGDDAGASSALSSAPSAAPPPMQAQDVYEWLVRRGADEKPAQRLLAAIRTAVGIIVPFGGRAPLASASGALVTRPSQGNTDASSPQDVFFDVLLTCVELPASAARSEQRAALETYLKDHGCDVPTSSDDSAAWWRALARARAAYFSARRAFFLVRMELLRVALFQSTANHRSPHPHAGVVQDVVRQFMGDGLVDALLEEIAGREKLVVPAFYAHMDADLPLEPEKHLRGAQHLWEKQLLEEEELLRELLVLALQYTKDRVPLSHSTQVIEHVLQWPAVVVPELFSQHSLAVPLFQRTLRRVAALGSMATLQLLHRASASSMDDEWPMIHQWSREFVAREAWRMEVDDHHVELCDELTESGVVLVAWASLLAKLYRRTLDGQSRVDQPPLERELQTVLKASEEARGFQQVRDVLRRLVFDSASPSQFSFLKSTAPGTFGAASWDLPQTMAIEQGKKTSTGYDDTVRVAVFQVVGAAFLDDSLSALGYVEHVEEEAQLNAMVKLIRPVLANSSVAEALLQDKPIGASPSEYGSALATLAVESRAAWPQSLLPGLRVLTALCAAAKPSPTPSARAARAPAVQLALTELAKKRKTTGTSAANASNPWRQLPPDEFLEFIPEQELVVCKKAFAYADDDRLLVTEGTRGMIDQDDQGRDLVQWELKPEYHNAWETLLTTLETLVDQIQTQPLIAIDSPELETFTAFLELLVQSSNGADSSVVLTQVMQQWAHARLKQWWQEMGLPNGASSSEDDGGIPALLIRSKVSLRVLQSASREDLVAWGVHDRFMREQILARIAFPEGASSAAAHKQRRAASRDELEKDGLSHLLRMLLGFLDGFVNEHSVMADEDEMLEWTPKQLHFVSAILAVLAKLTSSLDICIDVLIHELGGGTEECVQLVLKSTRKLFEYHESTAGSYTGLFASLTVLMNISRWCIAREAIGVTAGALSSQLYRGAEAEFRAAERHWLVATVEFIMEIVSTHETWRFVAIRDKWALLDRCYRIFTALLTASYQNAEGGVLREFQDALRHTIVSDKPMLMKVLRSASRLVSKDDISGTANDVRAFSPMPNFENPAKDPCLYPFTFEREVGNGTASLLAREALVASSLRLLDLVMEQSGASSNVATLLMMPIDGDGIPERTALNLVTLSGGYLAYPLSKNSEIVVSSLRTLRRAVEATSTTATDAVDTEQRSLVTLFRENSDLEFIRDTLLGLVRSPGGTGMLLRKELLELLTTCLDNQPGFFAVLVLDEDGEGSDKTKRLVAMVERFLETSDKMVEGHTDVLCSILRFLRHIWLGGVKERRKLHLQIASALRQSSRFWKNLTQVLRIRLPLSMDPDDDDWAMSLDQEDDHIADVKSIGRSGVYASLARGMILEIVSCEWHFFCSDSDKTGNHPLVTVLDSFREEGLYAHWLRTFTRLDYNASRFAEVADSVKGYVMPLPRSVVSSADNGESVLLYHESVVVGLMTLRWQLEPAVKRDGESLMTTWKRTKWSALVSAHAAAQIHALGRWKVFMELYSLQPGATSTSNDADDSSSSFTVTTSEHRKRKESMIATPPRTVRPNAPVSPLHQSASSSFFSGDRTSYGIVQVLSETVLFQLQRHERDQEGGAPSFDLLSLSHLKHLVELLVSMLHHQIRVVVRKTRDPKLSATRARDTTSGRELRLTVARSIELLALVERAAREVFESNKKSSRAAAHSITVSGASSSAKQASLWEHLVGASYGQEVDALALELRSSLLTAALLLTRHITTQFAAQDRALEHELVQRAVVVQVKLTQHAIESIKLCDCAAVENKDAGTSRLFQVSWSLLHALLDDFTSLTVAHEKQKFKLDAIVALGPLVALLQHETNGLRALFEIVTDRFQPTKTSVTLTQQLQACAVLRGINAVVWNPKNAELCRHVMLDEDPVNGFSVLRFFAKKLVPCLRERITAEQSVSSSRGYRTVAADTSLGRSSAHIAWCSVLMIASGLVRQLQVSSSDNSVWEFVSSAETLLATALSSTPRLNRAVVEEQACALTFLNALSASRPRRKQWREMLPKNHLVLMEQSRLALRRACVLLGNSSYTAARKREQQHQAQLLKKPRRLSVTAWPLSSSPRSLAAAASASLTFAHQTLLHEQLEATTADEKRQVTAFYTEMESKLTHVVEQGTHLLLKWTASMTSRAATVSVQGSRFIDDEQLIPLLALVVPSESLTLTCEPGLGHLCIAMEYCVEQLKKLEEKTEKPHAAVAVAVNALQTSALLFLKTYLLHVDQQQQHQQQHASESNQETQSDFAAFFEQLIDELNESSQVAARVDVAFLQQILKVVQLKAS